MQTSSYGIESLLLYGDPVIKGVAIFLLLMSIASWFVIVVRALGIVRLNRMAKLAENFWHAQSFPQGLDVLDANSFDASNLDTSNKGNPFRHLAEAGKAALEHHATHKSDLHGHLPLTDWLTASLRGAIDESVEDMQKGLSVLASVGSTAPFVGLFGTVWGIYHALLVIGASGQASIDKVAGPVGEALVMTAFGLAVAIPAVLGYNALVRSNKSLIGKLNRFAHQLHPYFLVEAGQNNHKVSIDTTKQEGN